MAHSPPTRPPLAPSQREPVTTGPMAEMLAEFGGACCPSVAAVVEHLIDRYAHPEPAERGLRP